MPERTQPARSRTDLVQRVDETLGAIDAACATLSRMSGEVAEVALEAVKDRVEHAAAGPADDGTAGEPPEGEGAPRVVGRVEPAEELMDEESAAALSEDLDHLLVDAGRIAGMIEEALDPAAGGDEGLEPSAGADEVLERAAGGAPDFPVIDAADEEDSEGLGGAVATREEGPPAEDTEPDANIEALDEELAGLAHSIVQGEFEDAAGALDESLAVTRSSEPATEPRELSTVPAASNGAGESPPLEAPPAMPARAEAGKNRQGGRPGVVVVLARLAGRAAAPLGARVLLAVSKPTAGLSASTRDTVGWLGLYTAFLGVCVWGFLLLFRKPITPEPLTEPVHIVGAAEAAAGDD